MFDSEARTATGRYRVEMVAGQYRQNKHQEEVQRALDEGSSRRWTLVNATTTNATGAWVTAIYWDTAPDR